MRNTPSSARARQARFLELMLAAKMSLPIQRARLLLCLTLAILSIALASQAAPSAELVVRGANVLTMDPGQPRAEAFAVSAGQFVAVGSNESIREFVGSGTRVLDLDGQTVVTGFIDAHAHPGPEYPEDPPCMSRAPAPAAPP